VEDWHKTVADSHPHPEKGHCLARLAYDCVFLTAHANNQGGRYEPDRANIKVASQD